MKSTTVKKTKDFKDLKSLIPSDTKKEDPEKENPATVYQRIIFYFKKEKISAKPSLQIRQEIGNLVKEKFFNSPGKKRWGATKVTTQEPEGRFKVLMYPPFFVPTIDSIIENYFSK